MKDVEKITDDAFMIKYPTRPNWFVTILVFLGKNNIGLVDSGFENAPKEYVFPLIKELGRSLDEINYVVYTHRDRDHTQGIKAIREHTKASIAAHELEVEAIQDVDIELKDGDTLELGERRFNILHLPGHRPGAIGLYDLESLLLISGDVICGDRVDLIRMDKEIYIASLRKLLDLEINLLLMGHPFKPLGKAILTGGEAKEMIEASILIAERL